MSSAQYWKFLRIGSEHHCQMNRAEIEIIAEAARLTMEFGRIFPLIRADAIM